MASLTLRVCQCASCSMYLMFFQFRLCPVLWACSATAEVSVRASLSRCLQHHGIHTVLKSDTTLRKHLVRPKDPVPFERKDSVVYRIPCGECDKVYIRETGRPVSERIKEHQRDVRLARTETLAVAEHAHKTGHNLNLKNINYIE